MFRLNIRPQKEKRRGAAYLFFGSKEGLMQSLFGGKKHVFYRFAVLPIPEIPEEAWLSYISLAPLFHNYIFEAIDGQKNYKFVIKTVLTYGDWERGYLKNTAPNAWVMCLKTTITACAPCRPPPESCGKLLSLKTRILLTIGRKPFEAPGSRKLTLLVCCRGAAWFHSS